MWLGAQIPLPQMAVDRLCSAISFFLGPQEAAMTSERIYQFRRLMGCVCGGAQFCSQVVSRAHA